MVDLSMANCESHNQRVPRKNGPKDGPRDNLGSSELQGFVHPDLSGL